MPFSFSRLFGYKRRESVTPHAVESIATKTPPPPPTSAREARSSRSEILQKAHPIDEKHRLLESSNPNLDQEEHHTFIYQDINPPSALTNLNLTNKTGQEEEQEEADIQETKMRHSEESTENNNTSLPVYNDVSGAVVVDWNGLPRFLSAQEEEDRQSTLEQAVRERMMGLPRRTEFTWAQPCQGILPEYSPAAAEDKHVYA